MPKLIFPRRRGFQCKNVTDTRVTTDENDPFLNKHGINLKHPWDLKRGEGRRGLAPKSGVPNISRFFFPFSRSHFRSFSLSLWGSSRCFLVVFLKRGSPQMCTFRVCGLSCEALETQSLRGFTRQPENSKLAHLGSRQNTTKIPRASRETEKRIKMEAGEGKKERH